MQSKVQEAIQVINDVNCRNYSAAQFSKRHIHK